MGKPFKYYASINSRPDGVVRVCSARRTHLVLGVLAALVGCRGVDNAQVDLLERELRQQEDYIYELEDYLIEYSEKLRHYRMACEAQPVVTAPPKSKTRTLRGQPNLVIDPPRSARPVHGRATPNANAAPAEDALPNRDAVQPTPEPEEPAESLDPSNMEDPGLEIGEPNGGLPWRRADEIATAPLEVESAAQPTLPDPVDYEIEADLAAEPTASEVVAVVEPTLPPVAAEEPRLPAERLEVRRLFSQPAPAEGEPPSLLVVVEALNAKREPVEAAGRISVMVMGPDSSGAMHRVDRWDFTVEESQAAWQTSRLGDGLHLQLPLGATPLPEGPLELWARLVNDAGLKLLARYPMEAAKLTAIEDAAEELAAGEPESEAPSVEDASLAEGATPISAAAPADAAAAAPAAPQWRTSTAAAAAGPRAEGFGSTLGSAGVGWVSRGGTGNAGNAGNSGNSTTPRVADRAANSPAAWRTGAPAAR